MKNRDLLTQFLFSLMIFVGSWLFFQILSMLTGGLIFGLKMDDFRYILTNLDDPVNINYLKYVQTLSSIGMFIISSLIIARLLSEKPFEFLALDKTPEILILILVITLMTVSIPMNNYFGYINAQLQLPEFFNKLQVYFENKEAEGTRIMNSFLNSSSFSGLLLNLFIIAVVPAIGEELFFRGILQNMMIRWTKNSHWGILITGFAFALLHFQFLSLLPRIAQGILLGYLFLWTKSLWYPIIAHFINNALAVVFYHYYFMEKVNDGMETIGTPDGYAFAAILSLAGVVLLLYLIARISGEKQALSR
ncbi:MAG: CPBP family intramembrane metalloprotease [Bacteroidales bacterium]|nr:CPBP family intramembrane metalloprotease [Bacteroidales bacterium]